MSGSIIIAAHNESAVIERCLAPLVPLIATAGVRVIVVCNGCRDDTADRARRLPGVEVIELEVASKTAALRAGDRAAGRGPRLYLDADVVLPTPTARSVLAALEVDRPIAARPPVRFETGHSSAPVRAWYRVRVQLTSISRVLWGNGMYAMSEAGRARFGEFPEIVSDDLFVQSLFADDEVRLVDAEPIVVFAPARSADLVRILTRTYRTQREVHSGGTGISAGQRGQLADLRALLARHPGAAFEAAVYVAVIAWSRLAARKRSPAQLRWERDDSSRAASGTAAEQKETPAPLK